MIGAMITNSIWTGALLAGIWHRQNWARCAFLLLLILGIVLFMALIPGLVVYGEEGSLPHITNHLIPILILACIVNFGVARCLITSPHIRRLTDRSRD